MRGKCMIGLLMVGMGCVQVLGQDKTETMLRQARETKLYVDMVTKPYFEQQLQRAIEHEKAGVARVGELNLLARYALTDERKQYFKEKAERLLAEQTIESKITQQYNEINSLGDRERALSSVEQSSKAEMVKWHTWSDSTGSFKAYAKLVGLVDDEIVLKKDDKIIHVTMTKLSSEDQAFIEQWKINETKKLEREAKSKSDKEVKAARQVMASQLSVQHRVAGLQRGAARQAAANSAIEAAERSAWGRK